jgi:hypothetical protein
MGRPPKLTPHQVKEALCRRDAGEPMRDIGHTYNVSHSTISMLGAWRPPVEAFILAFQAGVSCAQMGRFNLSEGEPPAMYGMGIFAGSAEIRSYGETRIWRQATVLPA